MKKKPLIETNPYLRDPEKYEKSLNANVLSSTAIEIGKLPPSLVRAVKKPIKQPQQITFSHDEEESAESPR